MTRIPELWNRFWFDEVDPRPYALLRMGVALAGLQLWCGTLPLLRHYYSDAGEWPLAAARAWAPEYVARFFMWDVLGSFPVVSILFALWGIALTALLLGWRTRTAAWVNWLVVSWFFYRNATFTNGGDEVLRLVSFYLALGYSVVRPEARAYSVDRARSTRATAEAATMPAWPLRFVQIQIGIVYLVAGFWKVVGAPWWDGSALYYALANDAFSRFGAPAWAWARPLYAVATVTLAWWEFLFPALMILRRTRMPALLLGVAVHLWILAFMNIGVFPFIMLACYPAFLKGDEVEGLLRRARLLSRVGGPVSQANVASSTSTAQGLSA